MEENTATMNEDILNALQDLNANTVATNDSVKELQEYLIIQQKKEDQEKATLKKQAEQEAEEQAVIDEQTAKEEESALAESNAKAEAETETYTELLTDIRDQISLNNELLVVNGIYIGIVVGLLFMKVLSESFCQFFISSNILPLFRC